MSHPGGNAVMATSRGRGVRSGCAVAVALACMGCGGSTSRITGRVTLDGSPLTTGVVSFLPVEGGAAAYGTIDSAGRYEVHTGSKTGLAPGDYVVTVAANAAPSASAITPSGGPKYAEPMLPLITPLKYAVGDRTPLRASVRKGRQTFDWELISK